MGKLDKTEYMPPFYAPKLEKWVITERKSIQEVRKGSVKLPLILFDEKSDAEEFFNHFTMAWGPKSNTIH